MNLFQIKIIAIVSMVIDHIGLFFFPQYEIFRIIGRIAFPLFAWFIANGARYTHNIKTYALRLFAFALISQIPFTLANLQIGNPLWYQNVIFTLFFGLLSIIIIKNTKNKFFWILGALVCAALAGVLNSDYGAAGVFSIIAFYLFFDNMTYMFFAQSIILFVLPLFVFLTENSLHMGLSSFYPASQIEGFGLLSLFFISLYNKKRGLPTKYLFYYFYPIQYIVIFILKLIM